MRERFIYSVRVYQALLTRRYLTSKIMPLLAMAAVTLSVATVVITWSVMGGFLKTLLSSGRTLVGDVAITWPNVGFGHYEDLIERLEADERIAGAAPIVETYGLVQLPDGRIEDVFIRGIDGESFSKVTDFESLLWWRPLEKPMPKDYAAADPRLEAEQADTYAWMLENGRDLSRPDDRSDRPLPAVVLGIEVSGLNKRTSQGFYQPYWAYRATPDGGVETGQEILPLNGSVGLTLLTLDRQGRPVDSITRNLPVANEFQSGIYEADSKTVFVRLDLLQSMLNMDEAVRVAERDPFDPGVVEVIGRDPARVTSVTLRAAPGVHVEGKAGEAFKDHVREIYRAFEADHDDVPPSEVVIIRTWEDMNRTMIAAVRKETGLVLFVFGIVCFTTVFLVLSIFWSMVSEKTRDIGVLRALGASTAGVSWLWLRYGVSIGVVGSAAGLGAAWVIVHNINTIHDWLGETFGLVIWDPSVYYFVEIPREVEPLHAAVVFAMGVFTCVFGAALPAVRAGSMDPVRALRFE